MRRLDALASKMPDRYRVLVLAAAFTGLRWGELIALRRCDVDLAGRVIFVRRRLAQLGHGGMQEGVSVTEVCRKVHRSRRPASATSRFPHSWPTSYETT
jgi:integrase